MPFCTNCNMATHPALVNRCGVCNICRRHDKGFIDDKRIDGMGGFACEAKGCTRQTLNTGRVCTQCLNAGRVGVKAEC